MSEETTPEVPSGDDPRVGFAIVTGALHELLAGVQPDQLDNNTPCSEFSTRDLLDHVVMVMRRVAVIGQGGLWSTIDQEQLDAGWGEALKMASSDVKTAWTDAAKLNGMYQVPWGEVPGAPLILTYTAELAVHGWDIAQATGQDFTVDDMYLHGALQAAKFIPAEGRGEEMPFDPVVDPGEDAPVLLQIAGWMGRQVA